jgi:hypothetical protein
MISDYLLNDPRMHAAIEEFTSMIADRYPSATLRTYVNEEPVGVFLHAAGDIDDPDEVMDWVIHRVVEIQVDDDISRYVLPVSRTECDEIQSGRDLIDSTQ